MESDTWESRENLENAGDLVREIEEKYKRDSREVRQQEKVKDNRDYWREEISGQYTTRRLFGCLDGEYDKRYWQRLEEN